MTDLCLNLAPSPDLLNAASSLATSPAQGAGAAARSRPDTLAPAEGDNAGNAFAALLSGVLQGTQPPTQAASLAVPGDVPVPALDERPEDGTDALTLLALPGSATPLPAGPGGSADAGRLAGNTLPVPGNPLPAEPSPPAASAGGAPGSGPDLGPGPAPGTDAPAAPAATAPGETRPRISLADLALSRPLEVAPGSAVAVDRASADLTALALRGVRTNQNANAARSLTPQSVTQNYTPSLDAAPAATGADELPLRLTAADFLRGTVAPGAGTEILTGQIASQIAAFATSNDGGSALPGSISLAGPGGTDSGNAALLGRPGTTTLPVLQPLGNASGFAGGLADRLLTLGGPGAHSARLQLHPEHLGELNVEIRIDNGSAQVWFGTTTSQARDAIEASLPRLRELFADQGIALTRTQVDTGSSLMGNPGSDQQRRMAASWPSEANLPWRADARTASMPGGGLPPAMRASTRLVDVWA